MSSPARPRRSTAKEINYKDLFKDQAGIDISSSSSGGGSGGEDADDGAAKAGEGAQKKGKGKGKAAPSTSDRDKKGRRRRRPSTSSEPDSGEESVFELASDQEAAEADESDSVAVDDASSSGAGGDRMSIDDDDDGSDIIHVGPRAKKASLSASRPRKVVRVLATTSNGRRIGTERPAGQKEADAKRTIPPALFAKLKKGASMQKRHPMYLQPWGPLWLPPEYVALPKGGFIPANRGGEGSELQREPGRAAERARTNMMKLQGDQVVGVAAELVEDCGWHSGKWDEGRRSQDHDAMQDVQTNGRPATDGVPGERPKWGGWYDSVRPRKSDIQILTTEDERSPYLPRAMRPSANGIADDDGEDHVNLSVGPLGDGATQRNVRFERFASHRLDSLVPGKPGHIIAPLGRPAALSFLPGADLLSLPASPPRRDYLCIVAATSDAGLGPAPPPEGQRKGGVQIWSAPVRSDELRRDTRVPSEDREKDKGKWRLDLFLAVEADPITAEWCPRGGTATVAITKGVGRDELPALGILAVALSDGSVSFFAVPEPSAARKAFKVAEAEPVFLKLRPRIRIELPGPLCLSLAWGTADLLACGLSNGHIVLFHVARALETGTSRIRPSQYLEIHDAAIRHVSWIQTPPLSPTADPLLDGEPTHLVSAGMDGSSFLIDLRDSGSPVTLSHMRGAMSISTFDIHTGTVLMADTDYRLRSVALRPRDSGMVRRLAFTGGYVWGTAQSDCHPFIATASSDGTCRLTTSVRRWKYRGRIETIVPKVFRIDYNRRTGELRMVDNILAETQAVEQRVAHLQKAKSADDPNLLEAVDGLPTWPAIIAVTSVAWNPSIRRCAMLASGMACGLVRIDWLEGPSRLDWDTKEGFRTNDGKEVKDEDEDD